jgi:DNA (cytosine-5)-methyltransferase 1
VGFEVVGVDIKPQPHYPFEFHLGDALTYPLEGFDAYHASPPCQAYSKAFSQLIGHRKQHPDLVAPTRDYLNKTGKPFVIENVVGAPMANYIQLEGTMFGLKVKKVRNFELHGFEILLLPSKFDNTRGWIKDGKLVGIVQHWAGVVLDMN